MNKQTLEHQSIEECLLNYEPIKKLPTSQIKFLTEKIGDGIREEAIIRAAKTHVQLYWENTDFIEQYCSISYKVKTNIDVNFSSNINKPNKVREYAIKRLFNYMLQLNLYKILHVMPEIRPVTIMGVNVSNTLINSIFSHYLPCINPSLLGKMKPDELNPLLNKHYLKHIELRKQQKIDRKFSTTRTCPKCKNKETHEWEIQVRRADEGGTLTVECIKCEYRWFPKN